MGLIVLRNRSGLLSHPLTENQDIPDIESLEDTRETTDDKDAFTHPLYLGKPKDLHSFLRT